ncbi:MAG: GNAT family N-acetyltransferase [Candidatus Zixiibacteriota bacterium]
MVTTKIKIRRTKASDLTDCLKMVFATLNHLRKKSGMKAPKFKITGPDPLMVHMIKTDPEATYVAVDGKGKIVGFTQALIRNDEWYLGWLYVDPKCQSSGVGKKLLKLAMDYGRKDGGIKRWALTTFAFNPQALAIYSKMGMTPQMPVMDMIREFAPDKSPAPIAPRIKLKMEVVTSHKLINRLTKLDVKVRGIARPEEHFFWLDNENHRLVAFYDGTHLVGYGVVTLTSRIGPIAAVKPEYVSSMLAQCINYGIELGQPRQVVFANGENVEVVQMLLKAGFQIEEAALVMASERFADADRYVPGHLAHY